MCSVGSPYNLSGHGGAMVVFHKPCRAAWSSRMHKTTVSQCQWCVIPGQRQSVPRSRPRNSKTSLSISRRVGWCTARSPCAAERSGDDSDCIACFMLYVKFLFFFLHGAYVVCNKVSRFCAICIMNYLSQELRSSLIFSRLDASLFFFFFRPA